MLEYIVRPFQAPNAHGTIIISSNPHESTDTAILTWGGESTLPPVKYIETGFSTKAGREDFTEKQRDAETVRITGQDPGDGPSYIDVSRGNKLYLDKETGRAVQADSPGQSDYVAIDLEDNPGFEPLSTQAPTKSKATITLNNNTAAAGS